MRAKSRMNGGRSITYPESKMIANRRWVPRLEDEYLKYFHTWLVTRLKGDSLHTIHAGNRCRFVFLIGGGGGAVRFKRGKVAAAMGPHKYVLYPLIIIVHNDNEENVYIFKARSHSDIIDYMGLSEISLSETCMKNMHVYEGAARIPKVRYSKGSLIRRFVIPNTQISYTWRFVNPKMTIGSLIRTFVALFRTFVIPKVRLFRRFVIPKVRLSENEIRFDIPKVR